MHTLAAIADAKAVWAKALRKEKAVGALVPVMIGGSVGGREAAAVALANLCAGNKDIAAGPPPPSRRRTPRTLFTSHAQ